jgi:AcrR family transcriptional regulator
MRRDTSTNPRKLPTQDRSKETVEAILQATAIVLKREGYDRASTRRVAEVAGVSVGSLYQYFPNKESLVVALYNRHLRELISMFESRFEESVRAPLPEARSGRPDPEDALARRVQEMFRAFLEEREAEIRPENLDLAAFMVIEAVEAITHAAVLDRPEYLEVEDFVEEISTLVLSYLSPDGASDPERT